MGNTNHTHRRSINIELILNDTPPYQNHPIPNDPQQSSEEEEEYDNEGEDHNDRTTPITPEQAKRFPFNCVGVLFNKETKAYGTGILIAPNLVLTAAHNLREFDQSSSRNQINYKEFVFYPGLSGVAGRRPNRAEDETKYREARAVSEEVFGIDVKSFRLPSEFTSPNSIEYDYALLLLSETVPRKQYFPLGLDYQFLKETITNVGYRQNDAKLEKEFGTQKMEESHGEHTIKNTTTLHHKITTTGGNSGGPIFVKREGGQIAIAIHKGKIKKDTTTNGARLINQDLLARVLDWEREFYREEFQSKINAFKMDASPSLQRVEGESFLRKMEDPSVREGLRKDLRERQSGLQREIESHRQECDALRKSIKELVRGFDRVRLQKQGLESKLRIEELNYNSMADEVRRMKEEIETIRKKQAAQKIERESKLVDLESLGIKWSKKTEITRASRRRTPSPSKIQKKQSNFPLKLAQTVRRLSPIRFWDTKVPSAKRFTLLDCKAILKNDDIQRYQISTLNPLPFQRYSQTTFKLRCYGHKRPISLGVITADRKSFQFSGGKGTVGTVAFWIGQGKGKVDMEGEQGIWREVMFLAEGQVLLMEIDPYNMKITFTLQASGRKFQYPLPVSFKEKELYPFVSMASSGDAVEILL